MFYEEFGVLMMHQPLIGWDFTTYLPAALLPYMGLLMCNAFNRLAAVCVPARRMEFDDDFETTSELAARGLALLQQELENHVAGRPLGLSIALQGDARAPADVPLRAALKGTITNGLHPSSCHGW